MFFTNRSHSLFVIILLIRTLKFSYCEFGGNIVGGAVTTTIKNPHAVFLQAHCERNDWICGSSVLNQKILLTAAHCVNDCDFGKKDTIHTLGGNEDIRKKAISRKVIRKSVHNQYDEHLILNDIAVVATNKNLPLNVNIKRVIIPLRQYPTPKSGSVAGWGVIDEETLEVSNVLKVVQQKVRDMKTCSLIGELHPSTFCAGSIKSTDSHPAAGDSGSAFITSNYQQVGLVSYRLRSIPALMVYTNVTYYYRWISDNSVNIYCKA